MSDYLQGQDAPVKTTSIRLDEATIGQLDTLANATERSRQWHIERAVRDYIAREMQFIKAVEEGIEDFEQGNTVPHNEVLAQLDAVIAKARAHRG
jgi:predicted transcriptional regulator